MRWGRLRWVPLFWPVPVLVPPSVAVLARRGVFERPLPLVHAVCRLFCVRVEGIAPFARLSLCVPDKALPCLKDCETAPAPVPWSRVDFPCVVLEPFWREEGSAAAALEFPPRVAFQPVSWVLCPWHCFAAEGARHPPVVLQGVGLCGRWCRKPPSADCAVSRVRAYFSCAIQLLLP